MFRKATIRNKKIRLAISGVSGTGKTYSSLSIAQYLGKNIALIDTERSSSEKYSNIFNFDVCQLGEFSIAHYIQAIDAAKEANYNTLIIDSLSHAWMWETNQASQAYNSFKEWSKLRPLEKQLLDKILTYPGHVIATMREKVAYETEEENGKKTIKKLGLSPVQSSNIEYEFDIYGTINQLHNLKITKSRCPELQDREFLNPGKNIAEILNEWIEEPWRNWSHEKDAIEYGVRKLPKVSQKEITQAYADLTSSNGKKAHNWVEKIKNWQDEEF